MLAKKRQMATETKNRDMGNPLFKRILRLLGRSPKGLVSRIGLLSYIPLLMLIASRLLDLAGRAEMGFRGVIMCGQRFPERVRYVSGQKTHRALTSRVPRNSTLT